MSSIARPDAVTDGPRANPFDPPGSAGAGASPGGRAGAAPGAPPRAPLGVPPAAPARAP
jgi:hypothetical protein